MVTWESKKDDLYIFPIRKPSLDRPILTAKRRCTNTNCERRQSKIHGLPYKKGLRSLLFFFLFFFRDPSLSPPTSAAGVRPASPELGIPSLSSRIRFFIASGSGWGGCGAVEGGLGLGASCAGVVPTRGEPGPTAGDGLSRGTTSLGSDSTALYVFRVSARACVNRGVTIRERSPPTGPQHHRLGHRCRRGVGRILGKTEQGDPVPRQISQRAFQKTTAFLTGSPHPAAAAGPPRQQRRRL